MPRCLQQPRSLQSLLGSMHRKTCKGSGLCNDRIQILEKPDIKISMIWVCWTCAAHCFAHVALLSHDSQIHANSHQPAIVEAGYIRNKRGQRQAAPLGWLRHLESLIYVFLLRYLTLLFTVSYLFLPSSRNMSAVQDILLDSYFKTSWFSLNLVPSKVLCCLCFYLVGQQNNRTCPFNVSCTLHPGVSCIHIHNHSQTVLIFVCIVYIHLHKQILFIWHV